MNYAIVRTSKTDRTLKVVSLPLGMYSTKQEADIALAHLKSKTIGG